MMLFENFSIFNATYVLNVSSIRGEKRFQKKLGGER